MRADRVAALLGWMLVLEEGIKEARQYAEERDWIKVDETMIKVRDATTRVQTFTRGGGQ